MTTKALRKGRKPREVAVVSSRVWLGEDSRRAIERILTQRGLKGDAIRDLTTSQILDEALAFHAMALEERSECRATA